MEARQREVYNTLKRIQVFVSENPLPASLRSVPSGFQVQVRALNAALAQMETSAVRKGSGDAYRRTKYRRHLRDALRYQHLNPIRKAARVLEKNTPGLPKLVNLPRRFGSEQALVTAARATLEDVTPFEHIFIAKGLPDNFLSLLADAIATMQRAIEDYEEVRTKKISGRAGISAALREGMDARQCLSLIVERCCAIDQANGASTLEAWNSVSRVHKTHVKSEEGVPEAGGTPVSTAVPEPAVVAEVA